ncbi:ECF-type sigma factor [Tautonia sociabilis]|uniref:Sigma-70 family RNA polymerase sigma factor n=1 Tax=Tautonia sociabilis TaxID=2080755 RepID=A0A432MF89_9BACT|nr:ECF-type sigma factor [Tautonia sociabilis]RUL84584.1 sigma-70 family RNA polymerase sigma factor [Tautonia sociabilis]
MVFQHRELEPEDPALEEEPDLIVAVYEDLRRAARRLVREESPSDAPQPTSLVNEAAARLLGDPAVRGHTDRRYVFAAAVRTIQRILVERARARNRLKRGGGWTRLPLDAILDYFEEQRIDVLELHDAIERLSAWDERQAETIRMRYFMRMTVDEIARYHGLSTSTVESDLALARGWLRRELSGANGGIRPVGGNLHDG